MKNVFLAGLKVARVKFQNQIKVGCVASIGAIVRNLKQVDIMNNRMLRYVEPEYPTRSNHRPSPGNYAQHVGYRAMYLTPEEVAKWKKDRPFKSKIHDMVHLKVYHGDMVGQSKSWLRAAKILEARDVWIPGHRRQEWY